MEDFVEAWNYFHPSQDQRKTDRKIRERAYQIWGEAYQKGSAISPVKALAQAVREFESRKIKGRKVRLF
jgi:hypothetical protein